MAVGPAKEPGRKTVWLCGPSDAGKSWCFAPLKLDWVPRQEAMGKPGSGGSSHLERILGNIRGLFWDEFEADSLFNLHKPGITTDQLLGLLSGEYITVECSKSGSRGEDQDYRAVEVGVCKRVVPCFSFLESETSSFSDYTNVHCNFICFSTPLTSP